MSRIAIARAFVLAGGVCTLGLLSGVQVARTAVAAGNSDPYESIDTLANALHHIQAHYLSTVSTTDLMYGAIDGMMGVLDAHSRFMDPDELQANEVRTEGVYSGIGVELQQRMDSITVVRTVPESPADGVLIPGDVIASIDGAAIETIDDASDALKGAPDTTVSVQFLRLGSERVASLVRTRVRDKTVRVTPLGRGWALAEISRFQRNTAMDLRRGLEAAAPAKGVIIDLRGNGGGLLDEAIDVVNLFADRGLIVQTRGRGGTVLERHDASPESPYRHLSVVLLVDTGSASASEIVAGSLRALVDARLVGTETFGKWSVQRVYVFEDKSALKLTVAEYEIADRAHDSSGLKPDVHIPLPTANDAIVARVEARLTGDQEALDWLVGITDSESNHAVDLPLGPLEDRLTQDPQLAAAWTTALANH